MRFMTHVPIAIISHIKSSNLQLVVNSILTKHSLLAWATCGWSKVLSLEMFYPETSKNTQSCCSCSSADTA